MGDKWIDAKKTWPKWGDLIWAHFEGSEDDVRLCLVGGLNQQPNHFFEYDEGQWKGVGSETKNCDYWQYAKPPKFTYG